MKAILPEKRKTKILVDGGDPQETLRIKSLIGFVDGQTTNPSLIAKNPEIERRIASGDKLSLEEQREEYKAIVRKFRPWWEMLESRLRSRRISVQPPNKC